MKTELPQDSPVCFHDFSVADESIAWSSCSSAGLASSSIHGAKLTLSLESTSFRLHNVALRFGIYNKSEKIDCPPDNQSSVNLKI